MCGGESAGGERIGDKERRGEGIADGRVGGMRRDEGRITQKGEGRKGG